MSQEKKEKNALGIEASIENMFEQKARPYRGMPKKTNKNNFIIMVIIAKKVRVLVDLKTGAK